MFFCTNLPVDCCECVWSELRCTRCLRRTRSDRQLVMKWNSECESKTKNSELILDSSISLPRSFSSSLSCARLSMHSIPTHSSISVCSSATGANSYSPDVPCVQFKWKLISNMSSMCSQLMHLLRDDNLRKIYINFPIQLIFSSMENGENNVIVDGISH